METKYIEKFKTKNFSIGSFDYYLNYSKALIANNSNISNVDEIIESMATTYRAAIVDKNNNYIGYIGLYNTVASENRTSIRLETNRVLSDDEKKEIKNVFKKWVIESLNLTEIEEEIDIAPFKAQMTQKRIEPKANIIIPSKILEPNVSQEVLDYFSLDYNIPKLTMPYTIKCSDRAIGIVGLTNVIWSNKRANLNIYLDKFLGDEIIKALSPYIIDDYINYVHSSNIHSVSLSVAGSNTNLLDLIKKTNMNYYGFIPYGVATNNTLESNMMFQHIPYMEKQNGLYLPENKVRSIDFFDTKKKKMSSVITLDDGYKMVSPKAFEKKKIDIDTMIDGQIEAMQERDRYTIPLGEDKYILQKGMGNYGISKAVMGYSYVVLNDKNEFVGYVNILRNNANNKNADIEIGISPKLQKHGLGKQVINKFYNELFNVGYASVTSSVFEFNEPSIRLHEKVAELNGIRLESYYINGKLWDMAFYTRVNRKDSRKK